MQVKIIENCNMGGKIYLLIVRESKRIELLNYENES